MKKSSRKKSAMPKTWKAWKAELQLWGRIAVNSALAGMGAVTFFAIILK